MSFLTNFLIFFTEKQNKFRTSSETDDLNVSFSIEEENFFSSESSPAQEQGRFENPAAIFFVEKDKNIYFRTDLIGSKLIREKQRLSSEICFRNVQC